MAICMITAKTIPRGDWPLKSSNTLQLTRGGRSGLLNQLDPRTAAGGCSRC